MEWFNKEEIEAGINGLIKDGIVKDSKMEKGHLYVKHVSYVIETMSFGIPDLVFSMLYAFVHYCNEGETLKDIVSQDFANIVTTKGLAYNDNIYEVLRKLWKKNSPDLNNQYKSFFSDRKIDPEFVDMGLIEIKKNAHSGNKSESDIIMRRFMVEYLDPTP